MEFCKFMLNKFRQLKYYYVLNCFDSVNKDDVYDPLISEPDTQPEQTTGPKEMPIGVNTAHVANITSVFQNSIQHTNPDDYRDLVDQINNHGQLDHGHPDHGHPDHRHPDHGHLDQYDRMYFKATPGI